MFTPNNKDITTQQQQKKNIHFTEPATGNGVFLWSITQEVCSLGTFPEERRDQSSRTATLVLD